MCAWVIYGGSKCVRCHVGRQWVCSWVIYGGNECVRTSHHMAQIAAVVIGEVFICEHGIRANVYLQCFQKQVSDKRICFWLISMEHIFYNILLNVSIFSLQYIYKCFDEDHIISQPYFIIIEVSSINEIISELHLKTSLNIRIWVIL